MVGVVGVGGLTRVVWAGVVTIKLAPGVVDQVGTTIKNVATKIVSPPCPSTRLFPSVGNNLAQAVSVRCKPLECWFLLASFWR